MFWTLLGYNVAKACASPRNSTWLTRPFLLIRGWGLGTRLVKNIPNNERRDEILSCSQYLMPWPDILWLCARLCLMNWPIVLQLPRGWRSWMSPWRWSEVLLSHCHSQWVENKVHYLVAKNSAWKKKYFLEILTLLGARLSGSDTKILKPCFTEFAF